MKALLIEEYSPATYCFIEGLHEATHCSVVHEEYIDAGVGRIRQGAVVDLVMVTIKRGMQAWRVVAELRNAAAETRVRCPYIMLLSTDPLAIEDAATSRDYQARCFLRQFAPPIYEEARVAFWMRQRKKWHHTIRVEFYEGIHRVFFCGDVSSCQLKVGPQVAKLAARLAGGLEFYAAVELADELGVTNQTIKKYMAELRRAVIEAMETLHLFQSEQDIFWMERQAGGTLCGLKANVI